MRLAAGCRRLVYLCHAGISEVAIPIRRRNGDLAGYLIMGKCLCVDSVEECKEVFRKLYSRSDLDRSDLASFRDLPWLGTKSLKTAICSLERIARNIERAGIMEGFRDAFMLQIIRMVEINKVGMCKTGAREDEAEKDMRKKVTCERIYGVLPFSRDTLEKKVMECCGEKLSDFLDQRIMIRAEDLLLNTCRRVDEIAGSLGYDPAGFNEFFKQHYGDNPGNFRKTGVDRETRFENALAARTRFDIPF